jgi:hypothetical protein
MPVITTRFLGSVSLLGADTAEEAATITLLLLILGPETQVKIIIVKNVSFLSS